MLKTLQIQGEFFLILSGFQFELKYELPFSSFTYHKTLRDGCMDIKRQLYDLGVPFGPSKSHPQFD